MLGEALNCGVDRFDLTEATGEIVVLSGRLEVAIVVIVPPLIVTISALRTVIPPLLMLMMPTIMRRELTVSSLYKLKSTATTPSEPSFAQVTTTLARLVVRAVGIFVCGSHWWRGHMITCLIVVNIAAVWIDRHSVLNLCLSPSRYF